MPSSCKNLSGTTQPLCQRPTVAKIAPHEGCLEECRTAVESALQRGFKETESPDDFWRRVHENLTRQPEDGPLREALIEGVEDTRLVILTADDPVCKRLSFKPPRQATVRPDHSYTDAQRALKTMARQHFERDEYDSGAQCIARILSAGQHLILDIGTMGEVMYGAHITGHHPQALRLAEHCARLEETCTSLGIAAQSASELHMHEKALRYAEKLLEKKHEKLTLLLAARAAHGLGKWKTAFQLMQQGLLSHDNPDRYQKLMAEILLRSGWIPPEGYIQQLKRRDLVQIADHLRSGMGESGNNPGILLIISIFYRALGRTELADRFRERHERRVAPVPR